MSDSGDTPSAPSRRAPRSSAGPTHARNSASSTDPTVPGGWDTQAVTPPAGYRSRLQLEGTVLAAAGIIGTAVLAATSSQSTRNPLSTVIQLLIVAALLGWLGPRGLRRSVGQSDELPEGEIGSGEPTPLWHIIAIVVGLTLIAGLVAGWDAGLRVTAGCALVGLTQAGLLAALVRRDERTRERTYYRVRGSRILRGTRLGYVDSA